MIPQHDIYVFLHRVRCFGRDLLFRFGEAAMDADLEFCASERIFCCVPHKRGKVQNRWIFWCDAYWWLLIKGYNISKACFWIEFYLRCEQYISAESFKVLGVNVHFATFELLTLSKCYSHSNKDILSNKGELLYSMRQFNVEIETKHAIFNMTCRRSFPLQKNVKSYDFWNCDIQIFNWVFS